MTLVEVTFVQLVSRGRRRGIDRGRTALRERRSRSSQIGFRWTAQLSRRNNISDDCPRSAPCRPPHVQIHRPPNGMLVGRTQ